MDRDPSVTSPRPEEPGASPLFFNTAVLARFIRVSYGPNAVEEAQRHVAAYHASKQHELAEIWKRVVAHLQGVELREDGRRIVKSAKPFRLRD